MSENGQVRDYIAH